MRASQKKIFRFTNGSGDIIPPDPGTLYSYRRDGSQVPENPSFHTPTVEYIDVDGNPQTFLADPNSDICGSFYASSIVNINYCLECE